MFVLIGFSFLAGVVTILSPCILPILPIVLSSSLTGGKKRPLGVVTGFILSFSFFTLALTAIVKATGVSADLLRTISVVIIFVFGLSILMPQFQILWEKLFSKLASKASQKSGDIEGAGGFWSGLPVGVSLGLIWTPCVGPIMASVLTLAATSSVTLQALFITLAYSFGTAVPMLAIIYGGRGLLNKVPFLLRNTGRIQKVFGVILIIVAVGIHFNYDRKFQSYVLTKFPSYGAGVTQLEDLDIVRKELDELDMLTDPNGGRTLDEVMDDMEKKIEGTDEFLTCDTEFGFARSFDGGNKWLNDGPFTIEDLRGKVVLLDFWTYTCINCIRTLPHLSGWYEKYKDDGFVIIGIHTPEFEFEKNTDNVLEAMEDFGIEYPVVQDNDYAIWKRYNNRFWPAEYFVDKDGCVRRTHFGEGAYEESEQFIQMLLEETGTVIDDETLGLTEFKGERRTPETYLGYSRIDRFVSPEAIVRDKSGFYTLPGELAQHELAYQGEYVLEEERAMPKAGAALEINFDAKDVYLVMRSGDTKGEVRVYLDGELIDAEVAGEDVEESLLEVTSDRLYHIVGLEDYQSHVLRMEFLDDGVELFAFTFG